MNTFFFAAFSYILKTVQKYDWQLEKDRTAPFPDDFDAALPHAYSHSQDRTLLNRASDENVMLL